MNSDSIIDEFDRARERDQNAKKQRLKIKFRENAIKSVMGSKEGRETLAWILSLTGQDESVTSNDALRMATLSGRRDVGLEVLRTLNRVAPEQVLTMYKEQNDGRE